MEVVITGIWLQLTLLLAIGVASHFIATMFGYPQVISQILIGIAIGPTLLGLITNIDMISTFAHLGAIVLLFLIGLECDLREIYTKRSIGIAMGGVILPWLAGYGLTILMGYNSPTAILLATTLVATSVAVTSAVLLDLKKLDTVVGKTIIGAAVVDDVLAMVVLLLAIGSVKGTVSIPQLAFLLFTAAIFIITGAFIGTRYLGKFIMFIEQKTSRVEHSGFITAMAIAFLYAFVAETIGISAIVGAFVAGTMFSEVPIKREFHEGTRFLGAVFGPIFFISIGIVVDFKCMFITYDGSFTWNYFLLGTLLAILGLFTKIIGCGIPAKLFKLSVKDSLMVGAGMAPRGEVALIMAMYMLILGLLTPQLYAAVVLMAICTTLIPIPLLKWLAEYRQKLSSNYKKFKL